MTKAFEVVWAHFHSIVLQRSLLNPAHKVEIHPNVFILRQATQLVEVKSTQRILFPHVRTGPRLTFFHCPETIQLLATRIWVVFLIVIDTAQLGLDVILVWSIIRRLGV